LRHLDLRHLDLRSDLQEATVIIIAVNDEMSPFLPTVTETASNYVRQKVREKAFLRVPAPGLDHLLLQMVGSKNDLVACVLMGTNGKLGRKEA
jgi:hypothetical protein